MTTPAAGDLNDDSPGADDRPVETLVETAVESVLAAAATWTSWDLVPVVRGQAPQDEWTPHKVCRRIADHAVDHLAEIHARLTGSQPQADAWQGRSMTTGGDLAPFTEADLHELRQRLLRLADIYRQVLQPLPAAQLDERPLPATWTLREVAHHVAQATTEYAAMLDTCQG
jgi:hypothetical protein